MSKREQVILGMAVICAAIIVTVGGLLVHSAQSKAQWTSNKQIEISQSLVRVCAARNVQIAILDRLIQRLSDAEKTNRTPGIDKIRAERIAAYSEAIQALNDSRAFIDCEKSYPPLKPAAYSR